MFVWIYKMWLRLAFRMRIAKGWTFKGMPFIRVGGMGSRIEIGDDFKAISNIKDNSIGVPHRVVIRTVASGAEIVIGSGVGVSGCVISAAKSIHIGDRVLIGSGALIFDSDLHPLEAGERHGQGACAPIVIEDDVFIGARAIILKGVTIGKGAVVGAGAVVTKDVQPGVRVAGNPAKVISYQARKNRNV